ncbi:hypothetical protein ACTQZR_04470 [Catenibacterium mitsuokai]|uniref:hypothetical protein n=1 Tax=Catenibacterium mitsuokai TaxID=100886 RepID=UPI003F8B74F4
MTNYELALELLDKGMADKHHTFNDTEYNEYIGYGVIDMDKMVVHDTANRFELPIEKYVNHSVKCVDERPVIANRRRGR